MPKPWLAGVLSLIGGGAGQYYAGARKRAVAVAALMIFLGLSLRALSMQGPWLFYLATLLGIGATVWVIWDAMRVAKAAPAFDRPPRERWISWTVFFLLVNGAYFAAKLLSESLGWQGSTQSYSIPSNSMAPTILRGEHVLVDLNAYANRPIERGDVVVFRHPRDEGVRMLKRVIGIAGDTIEMRKRVLHVNGQPVKTRATGERPPEFARDGSEIHEETIDGRTWRVFYSNNPLQDHFKAQVPAGSVYLLGDHRDFSDDSRFWGPVSAEAVEGKALFAYVRLNLEPGNRRLSLRPHWIK